MGISSFSTQYLPRNLRALGILVLFFGILFAWGGIRDSSLPSVITGIYLFFAGIMYFSLARGISKKEKWASVCGILLMGTGIITLFVQFFLEPQFFRDPTSWFGLMIGILITILLLISFVRSLKEAIVNTISITPFIITIIGFCLIIASWVFLIVYQQRQLSTFSEEGLSKSTLLEERRSVPPKGFLVPQSDSVPSQFKLRRTEFTDHSTAYVYTHRESSDTEFYIIEDFNKSYEEEVQEMLEFKYKYKYSEDEYQIEREFNYHGSEGVILVRYKNGIMTNNRSLYLNQSGHLFRITTSNIDFFSAEDLLDLLNSLQLAQ